MTSTSTYQFGRENPEPIDRLDSNLDSEYLANEYLRNSANEEQAKYLAAVDHLIRDILKNSPDSKMVYVFIPMYSSSPANSHSPQQNNPNSKGAYSHMKSMYSGKDAVASKYSGPSMSKGGGKAATSKGKASYSSK